MRHRNCQGSQAQSQEDRDKEDRFLKTSGIILASESPRRRAILEGLGFNFTVVPPETEEIVDFHSPSLVPIINAQSKAHDVANRFPSSLVIGADTVIEIDCSIMGKPRTADESRQMLRLLSGRKHTVVTGVCMIRKAYGEECVFCDTTEVTFKDLSDRTIDEYVSKVDTLDKAGAYAIQEHGELIIDEINGSMDNVVGFPTEKFLKSISLWPSEAR